MLALRPVVEDLYAFIGIDRRLGQFENMFPLPEGVCYNSYLIIDDKTAVIDSVDQAVSEQFYSSVDAQLNGRKLDYLICNHVEPDHCATIDGLLVKHPETTLVVSALGLRLVEQFYQRKYEGRVHLVQEGSVLELGHHTLETIAAPHVHWPEVTFTYEREHGWLFSSDAFGSFQAPHGHIFFDQVNYARDWLAESRRYYVNIVGRHGPHVSKVLFKFDDKPINMVLPLHGLILRRLEDIAFMVEKYHRWANYRPEEPGVVIVYGSMYGNSAQMADELAYRLSLRGIHNIRVYDVSKTDFSYINADCFRFSHAVFFCNNYNTELYPKMDAFLHELMMLHFDNHKVSFIGNGSWGGRGLQIAKQIVSAGKNIEIIGEDIAAKSLLTPGELPKLDELADKIAGTMCSCKIGPIPRPSNIDEDSDF